MQVLLNAQRLPEAAFFARAYCPSQVGRGKGVVGGGRGWGGFRSLESQESPLAVLFTCV